jgi:hypothetical protein
MVEFIGRVWALSFALLALGCGNSEAEDATATSDGALGCGKVSMDGARQLSIAGFDGL